MNHQVYVGMKGREDFLGSVRKGMESVDGQERLYDAARAIAAGLIRSNRPEEELKAWADAFIRVHGVALATDNDSPLKAQSVATAFRFGVIANLMADQAMFVSLYNEETVRPLQFDSRVLSWLRSSNNASFDEMVKQFGVRPSWLLGVVNRMAQHRWLDWREENGQLHISLTEHGQQLAVQM